MERLTIDAGGRQASGRSFQNLAADYIEFSGGLRNEWGDGCPLPYLEFSEPYLRLRESLLERCEQLGAAVSHTGDAQVAMAKTNAAAEQANVMTGARVEP